MNLESFIKTYLVDRNRRKSFRSVLSGWEFLSGLHRDGGEVPGALPGLIEALKKRDPSPHHLNSVISPLGLDTS